MSQSNNQYRLFFKKLTNIEGKSITSPQLRVLSFRVKRDLLTKATSTFEVLQVPTAIDIGDVVGMYDSYGTVVYLGVVTLIDDTSIEAEQMYGIFEDSWYWNNPRLTTIEQTLQSILQNDFQQNRDTLMASIFDCFRLDIASQTRLTLQSQEPQYVVDFSSFLYDIYEKYSIVLGFDIPYQEGTPSITIGSVDYPKLKIGNNSVIFRNFNIVTNTYETNKLVVYGEEDSQYRGEWYTTTSGITDNPSALNRIQKIKTNIVFSDDDLSILRASSLRNEIYNHEITCELVMNNKIISFYDFNLGQEVEIYFNSNYYDTILTGYELTMSNGVESGVATLRFGLVRTTLTSKLFKRLNR